MHRAFAGLLLVLFAVGCVNPAQFVEQATRETGRAAQLVQGSLGITPQVGFNTHNGRLNSVSFAFDAAEVQGMTLEQIQAAVAAATREAFEQDPNEILIVVGFQPVR